MNHDVTVHTEVAVQEIRPASDLGPHIRVARIRMENNRLHVICFVHTVLKTSDYGRF